MKQSIHEANMKWHAHEDEDFRDMAGKYALEFLKSMNGTLCYLMVALRMLAKAPWTAKMVCVHVRQAAIYAISRGWCLKTSNSHGIHFSRAELAHAAVPTFATATSWISPAWVNLKQCIEHHCTPFPWISDPADVTWHDAACSRHDTDVIDIQIGPWVYVSFRGNEIEHFPGYSTVTDILQDTSLESKGFAIQAFVCCNTHEVNARHFWLLEVQNGKPVWLFDSLEGLMPITLEVG